MSDPFLSEVAPEVDHADANLIVRAVNSHDELWGVLNSIRVRMRMVPAKQDPALLGLLPRINEVLAKAEGRHMSTVHSIDATPRHLYTT